MTATLIMMAAGATGLAWVWHTRPQQRRPVLVLTAVAGLGFQLVHALEHVVQAGAWVTAPNQPPFLTPWAIAGRDALAVGGDAALGAELLHLAGNLVFLAGLMALAAIANPTRSSRALRAGLLVQGAHVAEHVALTLTVATVSKAIGVTTLFGLLDAGPTLWTLRVTAHFTVNALATVAAGLAVAGVAGAVRAPLPTEP